MSPRRKSPSKAISVSHRLHIPRKCKLRADNRVRQKVTGTAPMQLLTVRHVTSYRYKQPVSLRWVHDVFGNCVAIARFSGRAAELSFDSTIRLDHSPANALEFQIEDYASTYPFSYGAEESPDLLRSIERQYFDPGREIDGWARQFLRRQGPTGTRELLAAMTLAIKERFAYVSRPEFGTQDPIETLKLGSGSCRDFAVLMMEAVRSLGLAARFVSGYLYVPEDGGGRVGGVATHAWLQVYIPGTGWLELDPTNGVVGNRDLIRVAVV